MNAEPIEGNAPGVTPESNADDVREQEEHDAAEVKDLIDQLRALIGLDEGELYTLRRGMLHHVQQRNEDNGLRRIRIMEEAFDAAYALARQLRGSMRGYRPDPALVISALVMHAARLPDAERIAHAYLRNLFVAAEDSPAP